MKKILLSIATLAAFISCQSLKEEWQPVFTFGANEPSEMKTWTDASIKEEFGVSNFTTIADMKLQYAKKTESEKKKSFSGHTITDNVWIKGRVVSDDRTGNLYRDLYLQDETGGIDLKLGKSSLYSDFKLGQVVYVNCTGLCIGSYEGLPQLGLVPDNTSSNEYETSYIDVQAIIDAHVFRGNPAEAVPMAAKAVTEAEITSSIAAGFDGALWGTYVTISGLTYNKEIFALLYPHGIIAHKKENWYNRVFLSSPQTASNRVPGFDYTWGVNTWGMSKAKYIEYIQNGNFDNACVGSGNTKYGPITTRPIDYKDAASIAALNLPSHPANDSKPYTPSIIAGSVLTTYGADASLTFKEIMIKYATANYVSHYFKIGSTNVQVRTSGYAKFSDQKIDDAILGGAPISISGILTIYNGSAQISLITSPDDKTNPSVTKL